VGWAKGFYQKDFWISIFDDLDFDRSAVTVGVDGAITYGTAELNVCWCGGRVFIWRFCFGL
jgi:hypothetical protein